MVVGSSDTSPVMLVLRGPQMRTERDPAICVVHFNVWMELDAWCASIGIAKIIR